MTNLIYDKCERCGKPVPIGSDYESEYSLYRYVFGIGEYQMFLCRNCERLFTKFLEKEDGAE